MKRPLFVLLIGLVLGELCGYLLYLTGVMIPASLLMAGLSFDRSAGKGKPFYCRGKGRQTGRKMLLLFLAAMFAGNLIWCYEQSIIRQSESLAEFMGDGEYEISGTVLTRKTSGQGSISLILKKPLIKTDCGFRKLKGDCIVQAGEEQGGVMPLPGERVSLTGVFSLPEMSRNPGGFDQRAYYLARGIHLKGKLRTMIKREKHGAPLSLWAYRAKTGMEETYLANLSREDAAMFTAVVLGDKSDLSPAQRKRFEENGMMHLLAVSGLHISAVGGKVYRTLRKRGFRYSLSCLAGAFILILYGSMSGWGASVLRAVIMFMVFLLAEYLGTSYDLVSSMSLSAILMLVEHPCRLMDGGCQISFAAVTGIGLLAPLIRAQTGMETDGAPEKNALSGEDKKAWKIWGEKIWTMGREGLVTGLAIYMTTAPLVMRFYYVCTPYSILLNLLVLPWMSCLLISALLSGLFGRFSFLTKTLSLPALIIIRGFNLLFCVTRKLPAARIVTGCPSVLQTFLIYGILLVPLLFFCGTDRKMKIKRKYMPFLFLLQFFFLCLAVRGIGADKEALKITMLDVGQGDCILIRLPGNKNILMDGGSSSKEEVFDNILEPALHYYGISRLDLVMISHMDEDHVSAVRELLSAGFPVRDILTGSCRDDSGDEFRDLAAKNHSRFLTMGKGDKFKSGQVSFSCLHPRKNTVYADRNEQSLVLFLTWKKFSVLFTGDLGSEQEDGILDGIDRPVTLLKVGHHGSRYSTGERLLEKAEPQYALISAGRGNLYGHPHRELLERLEKHGVEIMQTLKEGAICADTEGERIRVFYWKDR